MAKNIIFEFLRFFDIFATNLTVACLLIRIIMKFVCFLNSTLTIHMYEIKHFHNTSQP